MNVLVAVDGADAAGVAMAWAHRLAQATGAQVCALGVVSWAAEDDSTVDLAAARELRQRLSGPGPEARGVSVDRVRVLRGQFLRQVVDAASRTTRCVVLADSPQAGHHAVVIARASRVAVLVAREPRPAGAVLVTTAMTDSRCAELACAAELARGLDKPLMALHVVPAVKEGGAASVNDELQAVMLGARLLRTLTDELRPGADVVVARHADPLALVLELEERHRCDVLVVGVRVGSPHSVVPTLAETVARRTRSSVLVTPVE